MPLWAVRVLGMILFWWGIVNGIVMHLSGTSLFLAALKGLSMTVTGFLILCGALLYEDMQKAKAAQRASGEPGPAEQNSAQ